VRVDAVTVRGAHEREIPSLVAAYDWLFEAPGGRPPGWDPQLASGRLREALLAPRSAVFMAEAGGQLIGLCTAYLDIDLVRAGQRCSVADLAVAPASRSAGVGKLLLDAAKSWAKAHGATHLGLDTGLARVGAQRFYERERPDATGYSYVWVL
jgi:GNAT superfamily N-acetyltransferase